MMSIPNLTDAPGGILIAHSHNQSTSAVPSGGSVDPNNDVRGNITRLTARARQLLVSDIDTRVVRNGLSTYEMSRKTATDARLWAQVAGQATSSQASVELFMASLGFNLQEQLRLLHQLHTNQLPIVGRNQLDSLDAPWDTQASDELGTALEVFVANRRHEIMQRSVDEMHQRVGEMMQERSEAIIRSSWEKYSVEIADVFETASLKAGSGGGRGGNSRNSISNGQLMHASTLGGAVNGVAAAGTALQSHVGVVALLNGRDTASTKALAKVSAFAHIVHTQPPQKWSSHFTNHVVDDTPNSVEEVAVLWTTVGHILQPIIERGSAATSITYVSSSRRVMERKALAAVFSIMLKVESDRLSDMENMHATRFIGVVERYTSSSNPWAHIFTSMRCGRYDAAAAIAAAAGFGLVEKTLSSYASGNVMEQYTPSCPLELRALYSEDCTRSDPYRHTVLFLLLAGKTGESNEVVQSTVASLSSKVARSLEDTLWIRLFCLHTVDANNSEKIQSLSDMQRLLLDDMQDLVALTRGNVVRLASLMFHALLPSSGVRLLTENDSTYVDGVHLAMCFHNSKMLQCSDAEVPLDLSRAIQQYCSIALLDADRRRMNASQVGPAIFWYFFRTGLIDTFVDYCSNELVCARLFGHRAGGGSNDGALFQHGGVPPNELLDAMVRIAEDAIARGKTELAVHVLTVLDHAATLVSDDARSGYALSRAVQKICPALAQAFHNEPTSESANLFVHAAVLRERLAQTKCVIPSAQTDTFHLLCRMGEVHANAVRGNAEMAVRCFCNLPFVPASPADVERCAELFDTAPDTVATAAPPIIIHALRQLLRLVKEQRALHDGASDELLLQRNQAQQIIAWVRRWKRHMNRSLLDELIVLERLFVQ